jgi:hypothetical protein
MDSGPFVNSEFYTIWFSNWGATSGLDGKSMIPQIIDSLDHMYQMGASVSLYM